MLDDTAILNRFITRVANDPRMGISHIGLYATLIHWAGLQGKGRHITVFAKQVMQSCKISSTATYSKLLRELNEYGYIRYEPSFYKHRGSRIYIL